MPRRVSIMSSISAINNSSYYPASKTDTAAKAPEKEASKEAVESASKTEGVSTRKDLPPKTRNMSRKILL